MATIKTLFTLRSMGQAVEQWKIPGSFLLFMFFSMIEEHATRHVEIDFRDEKRRMAPFVHRRVSGTLIETAGYDKFIWTPPYIKPKTGITPDDLQQTMIGENPFAVQDPGSRLMELRNLKLLELENMIERREEWMAMRAVFYGSIPILNEKGEAIDQEIVFTRDASLNETLATPWINSASATPITDIRNKARQIRQLTGLGGIVVIHSTESADLLLESEQLKELLDNRRFEFGSVGEQKADEMGVVYMGTIDGIKHYRYDEWWIDPADPTQTEVPIIPANTCLVASTHGRQIRHYGAVETSAVANMIVKARRFPQYYPPDNQDPPEHGLQLHSAPLPATHQPNAFAVLTVA